MSKMDISDKAEEESNIIPFRSKPEPDMPEENITLDEFWERYMKDEDRKEPDNGLYNPDLTPKQ